MKSRNSITVLDFHYATTLTRSLEVGRNLANQNVKQVKRMAIFFVNDSAMTFGRFAYFGKALSVV